MAESKVGTVFHFFDRISVAAIELTGEVTVGDHVRFIRHGELLFDQKVASMQIEHDNVAAAEAGQSIGMKTDDRVHVGTEVYKIIPPDPTGL
jgi:putative protease